MVDVWLPYGKSEICVRVPTRNYLGQVEPKDKAGVPDAKLEIERALKEPVGSKKLNEILRPESRVVIVVDDWTKPAMTQTMISAVLSELASAGIKDENVTIVFGVGAQEYTRSGETASMLGEDLSKRVKTIIHDPKSQDLAYVGETKRHGTKVYLNRVFAEADVKILTGFVCYDLYAGYEGGRKSVLPGVSGEETIKHTHAILLDSNSRPGILEGNPIHEDMIEAARLAKVDFILNVVINGKGELVKAFAGDLGQAFLEAVKLVDEMHRVTVDRKADVVVVSAGGDPADSSLFEAFKAVRGALEVVKRGGVMVLVAECPKGHGNQTFYDLMNKHGELKNIEREIRRNFVLGGQMAYYLLEALQKVRLILVSSMPDYYASGIFKLKTARAVNQALNEALDIVGKNSKVWTVPYGSIVLPEIKIPEEQVLQVPS